MFQIIVILLFVSCNCYKFFSDSISTIDVVDSESGQILDEYKRSRIFHGVNVVFKEFPYYPNLDTFHPRWSFSKEDVDILADLGLNAIRLDVSWAGAEPIRGAYNETFFQQIHRIVDMCEKRGIYVLLEFHQDLFSERYCGNGAPIWASRPLNPKSKFSFPFPFGTPFNIDKPSSSANSKDCDNLDLAKGFFTYQVSQAFQDLYSNYNGVLDSFSRYWQKIAHEFKHKRNILGYEMINEPWLGQFWKNPLLMFPLYSDKNSLQPLYHKLQKSIRSVDDSKLLFFAPINTNSFPRLGFTEAPGGKLNANKTVLSWHYYYNPLPKSVYFKSHVTEAHRIGAGSFATEIDISWDGTLRENTNIDQGGIQMNLTLDSFKKLDDLKISWLGWEYKTYVRKTGWGDGLFDEATGKIRPQMAKLYSRPYARAVNGIITKMEYKDSLNTFMLQWTVSAHKSGNHSSEIFLSRKWHYPKGYNIIISEGAKYEIIGDLLRITTKKREFSQKMALLVTPKY